MWVGFSTVRDRVVNAATGAGDFGTGRIHDLSWAWYIIDMPSGTRWLTGASGNGAVEVVGFDQSLSPMPTFWRRSRTSR